MLPFGAETVAQISQNRRSHQAGVTSSWSNPTDALDENCGADGWARRLTGPQASTSTLSRCSPSGPPSDDTHRTSCKTGVAIHNLVLAVLEPVKHEDENRDCDQAISNTTYMLKLPYNHAYN
jgi:hypothetical protein